MSDAAPPPAADGEKSAREIEKERKKAEKLKKLAEKNEKKAKTTTAPADQSDKAKTKPKAKVFTEVPAFNDATKPGEKKILVDLDNPSLKAYNPEAVESSHYAWWEKQKLFQPHFPNSETTDPANVFTIIEPPPNVTGQLHMGHALSGTLQDIMIRYNRQKGKTVLWVPGVDHAGISTQTVVEKMLWRTKKQTRHDIGREKFLETAMEWKEEYHKRISNTKRQMGNSVEWEREAFTMDKPRQEAVSEAFIRLYEDGTIYRANKIINWDVQLRTAVSNLEVENLDLKGRTKLSVPGYEKKIDFGFMLYFQYEIDGSDEKLTIATTRPETMLGDTGVAVNPKDERYKHLIGKFAKHPFIDRLMPIVADDHVDAEFGTGVVKITPAHDVNDFNIGKRHNLDFINIFTDDGKLNADAGPIFEGQARYDARYSVIALLKERGLYVKEEDNPMILKLSERSKDVIEPVLKPQWWMSMKPLAKRAVEVVQSGELTIFPSSERTKYFRWMEDIEDWCLSRQLWWGHRVSAYYVLFKDSPGKFGENDDLWVAANDEAEARQKAEKKFPGKEFDLEQDPDVLDTWFSSGLWPMTTLGWPQKTADLSTFFPTSVLMTGWDILFFWAARMIMLSLKLTGQVPFKQVYCHPIVRDSEGRKMSKSLGNVIDPYDVVHGISLEDLHAKLATGNLDPKELTRATKYQKTAFPDGIPQCGTDALRFSLAAYSTGVTDIDFDIKVIFAWRKFCNKIYQAAKYLIGSIGDLTPNATATKSGKESLAERWILSKLTQTSKKMNEALDDKSFGKATQILHEYWLHDLCDTFIEQSKYSLNNGTDEEKLSVKNTLYTAFDGALTMIAPFMPFLAEELWQRIPRRQGDKTLSVSIAAYPQFDSSLDDPSAESDYELLLDVCRAIRSLVAAYPMSTTTLYVKLDDASNHAVISKEIGSVKSLSGKGVTTVSALSSSDTKPEGCVAYNVNAQVTIFLSVKGAVDYDAEITKAKAKLAKANDALSKSQKLLNDADYLNKVDEKVIEGERVKTRDLESEVKSVEDVIEQFEGLKVA